MLFLEPVGQRGEWRAISSAPRCRCRAVSNPHAPCERRPPLLAYAALRNSPCCSTPPPRPRQRDAACPHGHKAEDADRWGTWILGLRPGNGAPLRARVTAFSPPMRAWLEQPHGRHHKAPPQPCALTTTARECLSSQHTARERSKPKPSGVCGLFALLVAHNTRLGNPWCRVLSFV